jgi:hypothetical protein
MTFPLWRPPRTRRPGKRGAEHTRGEAREKEGREGGERTRNEGEEGIY